MDDKSIIIDQASTPLSHSTGELSRSKKRSRSETQNKQKSAKDNLDKEEDTKDKSSEGENSAKESENDSPDNSVKTEDKEKATQSKEVKEGVKEQTKEDARVEEKLKKKLNILTDRTDLVLFKAKSVFPFDLFPDEIIIDTTKVSIVSKIFFATAHVTSINLKDITDVNVEKSLFLGNVSITYLPRTDTASAVQPPHCKISLLWKSAAVKAHNIIRGITIANGEKLDIYKIPPEKLVSMLEQFGDSKAPI